jgi:hypothetical protein
MGCVDADWDIDGSHHMARAHPGFERVAGQVAKKQGVSKERARKIVAAGARKASKKAVKANPRLKRVSGVKKASEPIVSARSREQSRIMDAREARRTDG